MIDASDSADADYCVGFRDTEFGDRGACYNTDSGVSDFRGFQGYTIADDYFTNDPSRIYWLSPMFGLYGFFASHSYVTDDVTTFFEFRFIAALENDGARWTSGDSIDLFTLDWNNDVVTDNEGFELLSAAHLTAVGATFVAALMLM